jgi:hypothetical protein
MPTLARGQRPIKASPGHRALALAGSQAVPFRRWAAASHDRRADDAITFDLTADDVAAFQLHVATRPEIRRRRLRRYAAFGLLAPPVLVLIGWALAGFGQLPPWTALLPPALLPAAACVLVVLLDRPLMGPMLGIAVPKRGDPAASLSTPRAEIAARRSTSCPPAG